MNYQIIYASDRNDSHAVHPYYVEEEAAMRRAGIPTGLVPSDNADCLILRSLMITDATRYPQDSRFIHNYEINANYLFMDRYYPYIEDLTMETFFVDKLDDSVVKKIKERGWDKAFIKGDTHALEHIEQGLSIWPNHPFDEMLPYFEDMKATKYAIRKFYDCPTLDMDYHRYWVINNKIFRNNNVVPDNVKEAARRLSALGGKYFTIDATQEIIIEVNPGECSDRHGENSSELFASWFRDAFSIK